MRNCDSCRHRREVYNKAAGTFVESCSRWECEYDPKNVVVVDGKRYFAENPKLKTVHKDGEVVIGGFMEG